ncbi:hypothetical protein NPIL_111071 [Nephila pilipes]|uniref:Uncharacterized protein n=1 Tax=Nephila pilipes TaxID=299642 RepID=A0A8X6NUY4_NEPPI|nr:hypothetical protein NPIL_111071 [Nephila pilipes]
MGKGNDSSEEISEISCVNLCDLNLEEAYQRVDVLDTAGVSEGFCNQLEQLIYTCTKQNTDFDLDMKLISETQHIIIRCAKKANKLLSAELTYYLQQILENVRKQPTTILPPHLRLEIIKHQKRIREIWLRPFWQIRSQKKSKCEANPKVRTMTPNPCTPLLPRPVRAKMKLA